MSNDNPYSEALFRTLKYVPSYPRKPFESIDAAWAWVERFVDWYNCEHRHGAIGFVAPDERHRGHDVRVLLARRDVYAAARRRHPARWSRHPRHWNAPAAVSLNLRDRQTSARAAEGLRIGAPPTTSMVPTFARKTAITLPRHHAESAPSRINFQAATILTLTEDFGVLSEAVEQGRGELVVDEDAVPFAEGEVAGDDRGAALVASGEDVEEHLSAGLLERDESQLVDDEKCDAAKSLLQTREGPCVARFGERSDEVGSAVEGDVVATLDRLDAERRGEMGFAGADGTEQDDVARGGDPRAATELLDTRALEAMCAFPVELGERLLGGQAGGAKSALDGALGARGQLGIEQRAQVLQRRPRLGERLSSERRRTRARPWAV